MTTPTSKDIGFSVHAFGNPIRYVLKAPSEPWVWESCRRCAFALNSIAGLRGYKTSNPESFTGRRLPLPNLQHSVVKDTEASADDALIIQREGGERGFLRQLKQTVPAS